MQIKKLADELIYIKKTIQHTFDIDGKTIKVYEKNEDATDITEYEQEIDIADIETLTDQEVLAFKANITEALSLPNGDMLDIEVIAPEISEDVDVPLDVEDDLLLTADEI